MTNNQGEKKAEAAGDGGGGDDDRKQPAESGAIVSSPRASGTTSAHGTGSTIGNLSVQVGSQMHMGAPLIRDPVDSPLDLLASSAWSSTPPLRDIFEFPQNPLGEPMLSPSPLPERGSGQYG